MKNKFKILRRYDKLSKRDKQIVDEFADIFIRYRHLGKVRLLEIIRDLLPYSIDKSV